MGGLNLNRNQAPAMVEGIPEELARDMQAWVRAWPSVEKAIADFKKAIQDFQAKNRDLNQKAGRKAGDRSLSREQREALQNLVARTSATHDALERLL